MCQLRTRPTTKESTGNSWLRRTSRYSCKQLIIWTAGSSCLLDSCFCQRANILNTTNYLNSRIQLPTGQLFPPKKQIFLHTTDHLNSRIQLPTRQLFLAKSQYSVHSNSPEQQDPLAACSTAVPATTADIPAHKFSYVSYKKVKCIFKKCDIYS